MGDFIPGGTKAPVKPTRMSLADAMAQTGTTTPKAALAAMNQGRRGRNRFVLAPMHPAAPGRSNEAARRLRQAEKAAAKASVP